MKLNKKLLLISFLALIFVSTRLYNLNKQPIWEDSYSWLYRINYYPWLIESNFKGIAPKDRGLDYAGKVSYHPGATITTLSGFTLKIARNFIPKFVPNYRVCEFVESSCQFLQLELVIAKIPLILLETVLLLVCLIIIEKMLGMGTALIFWGVMSFEPFVYFNSRDLHLDFLQTTLMATSFLILIYNLKQKVLSYKLVVAAGFIFGLTLLTRFASVFFIPSILMLIFGSDKQKMLKIGLTYFSTASLTFVLLYPPMWVAPVQTLTYIITGSSNSAKEVNTTYVEGLTFYIQSISKVMSLAWIIFVTIGVVTFFKLKKDLKKDVLKYLLFFVIYLLLVNTSGKKYERYLLPTITGLTFVSAISVSKFVKNLYT